MIIDPMLRQIAWPSGIHQASQLLEAKETRREMWTVGRVIQGLQRRPLLGGAVVLFLLLCAFSTVFGTATGLANFRDVDYPDSSDLLRISEFARLGHIYPDGNRPPYMVSLYGPLTYVLLSIPYRVAQAVGITPQVLVRLGVVGAVCLCVLLIFLISKRLYNSRSIASLCALFAVSGLGLGHWTTQIRGDFPALALSLLSVYWFLLKNGRPQTVGSAICAGLAPLVKQTFFAAPIAIVGWLIYKRRYKEAALWATGVGLTVAGGYGIVWWREPLMVQTMAALRHPVVEYPHAIAFILDAIAQPVVPFAVLGAVLAIGKLADRLLLVFYCVAAWLVAILVIPQVGSNINYFWEPLFASSVLAGAGLSELQRKVNRTPILSTAILLILLLWSFVPMMHKQLSFLSLTYSNMTHRQVRKARWESFASLVSGRRLLSTSPDITVLSSIPEIPDPFLNSTLERRGGWDYGKVAAQIDAGAYDLIVVKTGEAEEPPQYNVRGVRDWSDGMWGALKRTYGPACVFKDDKYILKDADEGDEEVWLPRRGTGEILPRLSAIGCQLVATQFDYGSAVSSQTQ
jgi:Dolichyl-phosphate-mannose-protein mannosyltransferase